MSVKKPSKVIDYTLGAGDEYYIGITGPSGTVIHEYQTGQDRDVLLQVMGNIQSEYAKGSVKLFHRLMEQWMVQVIGATRLTVDAPEWKDVTPKTLPKKAEEKKPVTKVREGMPAEDGLLPETKDEEKKPVVRKTAPRKKPTPAKKSSE